MGFQASGQQANLQRNREAWPLIPVGCPTPGSAKIRFVDRLCVSQLASQFPGPWVSPRARASVCFPSTQHPEAIVFSEPWGPAACLLQALRSGHRESREATAQKPSPAAHRGKSPAGSMHHVTHGPKSHLRHAPGRRVYRTWQTKGRAPHRGQCWLCSPERTVHPGHWGPGRATPHRAGLRPRSYRGTPLRHGGSQNLVSYSKV